MKAEQERQAVKSLWHAIDDLKTLQRLMLDELLARDHDDSTPDYVGAVPPSDPVHRNVRKVVRDIERAADAASHARNTATHVLTVTPPLPGVVVSVTSDCQACGKPALPRAVHGYCIQSCYDKWKRFRRHTPDRVLFEESTRATNATTDLDTLTCTDEAS